MQLLWSQWGRKGSVFWGVFELMKVLPKHFGLQLFFFCVGNAFLKSYSTASKLQDLLGMKRCWDVCGSSCRSSLLSNKKLGKGGIRRMLIAPCYSFVLFSCENVSKEEGTAGRPKDWFVIALLALPSVAVFFRHEMEAFTVVFSSQNCATSTKSIIQVSGYASFMLQGKTTLQRKQADLSPAWGASWNHSQGLYWNENLGKN